MLAAAVISALMLQQAATGQVVWSEPAPAAPPAQATVDAARIPDSARADPYGYERAQCSPLIRSSTETLEACQARVRSVLAANMGDALPPGLAPSGAVDACRQEAAGDRYALQCGAPDRPDRPTGGLEERTCESRPQALPQGGVAWTEVCRPASGQRDADDGLTLRLGND
jgi:hypothetical protein